MRYPIGKFQKPDVITSQQREEYIAIIEKFPLTLKREVEGLSTLQDRSAARSKQDRRHAG